MDDALHRVLRERTFVKFCLWNTDFSTGFGIHFRGSEGCTSELTFHQLLFTLCSVALSSQSCAGKGNTLESDGLQIVAQEFGNQTLKR